MYLPLEMSHHETGTDTMKNHRNYYRLLSQAKFSTTKFQIFQEKNRGREVLIYAPEGGHNVVPLLQLEYAGEERKS